MDMLTPVPELLVEGWKSAYGRFPKITLVATVAILLAGGFGVYLSESRRSAETAKQAAVTSTFAAQTRQLDQAQAALRELGSFLDGQREKLSEGERTIQALRAERERLQPLVTADRRAVDALFAAQEERNHQAQSRERWFGFAVGIVASFLASILWYIVARYIVERRAKEISDKGREHSET